MPITGYNPSMELGERIKKVRQARRMSIKELAKAAGVASSTVFGWEKGLHEPQGATLRRVLEALDITYDQLFQDFDEVFLRESLEKLETTASDVEIVLTRNPHLSPSEVEVIMRIVLDKERELREKDKREKSGEAADPGE